MPHMGPASFHAVMSNRGRAAILDPEVGSSQTHKRRLNVRTGFRDGHCRTTDGESAAGSQRCGVPLPSAGIVHVASPDR